MNHQKFLSVLIAVIFLSLISLSSHATIVFPTTGWYALKSNGVDIADAGGDANSTSSAYMNIVGDASNPSVYVNSDVEYLYVRLRLDKSPYSSTNPLYLASGWAILIDTDFDFNDFESVVIVSGQKELVYHLENTTPSGTGNANDIPENIRHYANTTDVSQYLAAGTSINSTPDYFIDFAIAWSSLSDETNTFPIVPGQNLRFIAGVSGNNNTRIRETDADYASPFVNVYGEVQQISDLITDPVACDSSGCVAGDTTAPALTSFTSATDHGVYGPGAEISIIANYDEALNADSSMTVLLNNGASVNLTSVSDSTLSGTYTVGATGSGEDVGDLAVLSITSQSVQDVSYNSTSETSMPDINIDNGGGFTIDTTGPELVEITPVASPTADTTPDYTFASDEAGTLQTSGSCRTTTTILSGGANTITLDADGAGGSLIDGAYSGCTLAVVDEQGNLSVSLTISDFVVDASGPILQSFSTSNSDGTYGPGATIAIAAHFSETIADGSSLVLMLTNGQTVTLNVADGSTLAGTYTVGVTGSGQDADDLGFSAIVSQSILDSLGNISTATDFSGSNLSAVAQLAIDTTAPILSETTAVSTPTSDSTPSYSFYSNTNGTVIYGGACSGNLNAADAGTNVVILDSGFGDLPDGTYSSCTIQVTDAYGNTSSALLISSFTILTTDSDDDGFLDLLECPSAMPLDETCLDTDGDGAPNYLDTDSDDDGVTEEREVEDGTNPYDFTSVLDTDHDGVPDAVEEEDDTDPEAADSVLDSDADGYSDYVELQDGSDPEDAASLPADSDGDGVADVIEEQQGTDPNDAASKQDTDSDGVPDAVEVRQNTNPSDDTSFKDTDGDGTPDYSDLTDDSTPPDSGDDDDTPPVDDGDDDTTTPPADGSTGDDDTTTPPTGDDSGDDTNPPASGNDGGDDDDAPADAADGGGGCQLQVHAETQPAVYLLFGSLILLVYLRRKLHNRAHD